MRKLTIKELAPYLPYGLKIKKIVPPYTNSEVKIMTGLNSGVVMINHDVKGWADFEDVKPLLHPISDLAKEIEVNGERFLPIKKLFGTYSEDKLIRAELDHGGMIDIWLTHSNGDAIGEEVMVGSDFMKLFEWHFDVFALIPDNLAVDINTLDL